MIGHCGLDCLKKTAQVHGLKLKGDFKVFKDCAVAKARQKNLNKDWKGGSQVPGESVYLDISSIRDESYGGSCFWVLLVDDYTDYFWIIFLNNKSDLKSKVMTLLTDLKIAEINVKYIRWDDSGENKALFEACQAQGYGVKFEFSGPRTPQRNGKLKGNSRLSLGESELCWIALDWRITWGLEYGLNVQWQLPICLTSHQSRGRWSVPINFYLEINQDYQKA
jgi:hypothetical protein